MTEGDFNGKESQEGRQESSQEGQVTGPVSDFRFAKAPQSTAAPFFVAQASACPERSRRACVLGFSSFQRSLRTALANGRPAAKGATHRSFEPPCSFGPFWEDNHSNPQS